MPPNLNDALFQFRQAAAQRGVILPPEILDDGDIHRCDTTGRHGEGDGAYLLHLDGIPAGGFQNWQDGIGWQDWHADIGRPFTKAENAELKRKADAARAKREATRANPREAAAAGAVETWDKARVEVAEHPYLVRKGIKPHGVRGQERADYLLVPLYDETGALVNLQRIDAEGQKRFLYGGRITGCFFPIGTLVDGEAILIFEGFATGATGHEATGYPVAVAIVAGNLLPVAKALRAKYPNSPLVFGADDDAATALETGHNTGIEKATEAAKAVGGWLAVPDFGPDRTDDQTDFNDLAAAAGLDAVRVQIWAAKRASVGRTYEPSAALKIAEARVELAGEMSRFAKDAVGWCNRSFMNLNRAPVRGIIAPPGLGKTDAALKIVVPAVLQAGLSVVMAIPRHELGDQIVRDLATFGITARTYRSRSADDPEAAGMFMCREKERTGAIGDALGDVSKHACKSAKGICDYHDVCGYQRQKKDPPEVWIVAHECMTHPWPTFIPKPDIMIIDEAFYDAGEEKDVSLDLSTLVHCQRYDPKVFPPPAKGEPNLEYQELLSIAERAYAVLSRLRGSCRLRPDMFGTITAEDARHAYRLEFKRKLDINDVVPGMPRDEAIARALKRKEHNQEVWVLAKFWEFLAITLEDGHDESLYLRFDPCCSFLGTDNTGPGVVISSRRDLHEFITERPVLHLDGTMREPVVRQSFPYAAFHKIEVGMPPMTIVSFLQIADRVFGKSANSDLLIDEYRRLIEVVASDAPGPVGVICLKDVEAKLLIEGALPRNVKLAHYGNITGLNVFNEVSDLILIGRPEPAPMEIEQQGRLLFKRPVIEVAGFPELKGYYRRAPRGIAIRGRDEAVGVMGSLHPDDGVEALRWLACEAELLQAIYRARPLNRRERDPLNVHIATNVCLPIEVDEVMTWDAMLPILPQIMLARGGVWLQSYPDMAAAYPDLFSSGDAAQAAMKRDRERWQKRGVNSLLVFLKGIDTPFARQLFLTRAAGAYRELTPLSQVRYRRAGSRGVAPWGLYDPKRVPDLAEWFRERGCEVTILPDIED